jgi:hypothetical protein
MPAVEIKESLFIVCAVRYRHMYAYVHAHTDVHTCTYTHHESCNLWVMCLKCGYLNMPWRCSSTYSKLCTTWRWQEQGGNLKSVWVLWRREHFSSARNCTPGPCHACNSPVLVTGDIAAKKKNQVVFVILCFSSLFQNVKVLLIFRSKSIFKVSVLKLMLWNKEILYCL